MSKYERSLVLVKHDGVARGLVGEFITRFERVGLKIVGVKFLKPNQDIAEKHYPSTDEWLNAVGNKVLKDCTERNINVDKIFGTDNPVEIGRVIKKWNVEFLTFGPVLAIVFEGPDAIRVIRKLVGSTNPVEALPGTIRGDYTWDNGDLSNIQSRPFYNLIHASSSIEDAKNEINLWFSPNELYDYELGHHSVMGWHKKLS